MSNGRTLAKSRSKEKLARLKLCQHPVENLDSLRWETLHATASWSAGLFPGKPKIFQRNRKFSKKFEINSFLAITQRCDDCQMLDGDGRQRASHCRRNGPIFEAQNEKEFPFSVYFRRKITLITSLRQRRVSLFFICRENSFNAT